MEEVPVILLVVAGVPVVLAAAVALSVVEVLEAEEVVAIGKL